MQRSRTETNYQFNLKISKYTIDRCVFMVLTYHELQSQEADVKAFKKRFDNHHKINGTTIIRTYVKFEVTGSVLDDVEMLKVKKDCKNN